MEKSHRTSLDTHAPHLQYIHNEFNGIVQKKERNKQIIGWFTIDITKNNKIIIYFYGGFSCGVKRTDEGTQMVIKKPIYRPIVCTRCVQLFCFCSFYFTCHAFRFSCAFYLPFWMAEIQIVGSLFSVSD